MELQRGTWEIQSPGASVNPWRNPLKKEKTQAKIIIRLRDNLETYFYVEKITKNVQHQCLFYLAAKSNELYEVKFELYRHCLKGERSWPN